ncbi:MAG: sterol desaturase family protein [bacterium]|nr:sterol desaturase family protein [bacterium]
MEIDYIAVAVPAFFVLIAVELWIARRRGHAYYRLNDSLNDLATGVLQQLVTLLFAATIVAGYFWIHATHRLFDLSADSLLVWIGCFVGVDFAYYWFHRLSHEINFLWAAHVVHHQSEEYNLTVALRQSALQPFMSIPFYWPLALLGVPPLVFLACSSFNTLYQFWIHTREIGTLGPLEQILMTPSHHRVHHGRNPIYIDRNHGGTFIVWDKLFGTFEPESEEVVYGVTKPLASWNPVWANLDYWIDLARAARATRRGRDKLLVFLARPGWMPTDLGGFQAAPPLSSDLTKFDPTVDRRMAAYATFQFVQGVGLSVVFPLLYPNLGTPARILIVVGIVWSLVNVGALFDGARWGAVSEWVRIVLTPIVAIALLPLPTGAIASVALLANPVLAFLVGLRPGEDDGVRGGFSDRAGEALDR